MASYTKHDLEFILAQIKIAEADVAGGEAINVADLVPSPLLPWGLRTLSGEQNNLMPGQEGYGSADGTFPRLLDPVFNQAENTPAGFGPPSPTSYSQTSGLVFDSQPRTISNLIVDQTFGNRAAVIAALERAGSADAGADADAIAAAQGIAAAAAAALPAAQAAADAANASLGTAQGVNSAAQSALTAALDANTLAQGNKTAALGTLQGTQSATASALGELQAAQNAATSAASTLSLAGAALTTANSVATSTASQAATDIAARGVALSAFGTASAAAALADQQEADALATLNNAAPGSPEQAAAQTAYDAAVAASNAATAAANAALLEFGIAAATAAASTQAALDAAADQAAAQAAFDAALAADAAAQANLAIEEGEYQAAVDAQAAAQSDYDAAALLADGTAAALAIAQGDADTAAADLATAQGVANGANGALADAQALADSTAANAIELPASLGLEVSDNGSIFIPNQATDEGLSAQYNSWFTLFGQFFDHGLDLVAKGGSGTVFIPLKPDDPLYVEGSHTNFMVLTRATNQPGADGVLGTADDIHEAVNTTSPFVDQNQTYSSHPSHQVFLRSYELVEGRPRATGELIENRDLGTDGIYGTADDVLLGGMATWEVVKAQARDILGINLSDADVTGGPLLATDDYGNFLPGNSGLPQLVTATGLVEGVIGAPISTAPAIRGGYAFLDDIAHHAAPRNSNGTMKTADADNVVGDDGVSATYDDELLDAHYIAGDGRVNENIGLTAVHAVFHSEHNRLVEHTKEVVLASNDLAFLNEWLRVDVAALPTTPEEVAALSWDGERVFQAAKFGTEMQYQHLVFEEFARKVQVQVDVFAGYDSTINPSIVAEFAHVVYRFGHSMLNETVDRFDANFGMVNGQDQIGLIEAFLNPLEYAASGANSGDAAGAIVRGMTRQVGNELDEFVTEALRNNLVGLPLDLAAINLARGRETGVPSLNAARREFFTGTSDAQLKPYESWVDFANNVKHAESVVNFIAAYGTHGALTASDVDTLADKRAVATALVMGGTAVINAGTAQERTFVAADADRLAFLNSTGAYANLPSGVTTTGVDAIDFWIGGLAERQMPFGGLLGSTFNFVFETQMEMLQDGDRMYYLARTAGLNFLKELEANSFASMIMRNTDATHLPGDVFSVPNFILEVDQSKQYTGLNESAGLDGIMGNADDDIGADGIANNTDPTGGTIFSQLVVRDNPSTAGSDTNYLKFTGGEHVVLGGTAGNDTLIASIGDDTIWGDAGDDRIEGGDGVDILNGGEGHDIITDLGGDDNIKGGDGDDVVSGGNGFDLIIAGRGSDFVVAGEDPKEVFGGGGNDFILGSSTFDTVFGDEGDDWIEGGGSADLLQGDMGDPFQASTIFGNDVIIGSGGNDDYDSESGDDIMVMGAGTQRAEGMLGFDWVTHKNQAFSGEADLNFTGLLPPTVDNLKDRFDNVEGVSGWIHNDILRGDSFGSTELLNEAVVGDVRTNHALNNTQQIALIDGLQEFLDSMLGAGQTAFSGGNILMGGDGSDIIEGRGGNDLIDGDAWLNVRIGVSGHPTITSAENMAEIAPLLFSGEIKPSQLSIVREILSAPAGASSDIAVFSDIRDNYLISTSENGTVTVSHVAGTLTDGTDTLRNIERIQFSDQTLIIGGDNIPAIGEPEIFGDAIEDGTLIATLGSVVDGNGINPFTVQFTWQAEINPDEWADVAIGDTFTPGDAHVGLALRVVAGFTDITGVPEFRTSAPTAPVVNVNDAPVGLPTITGTVAENQTLTANMASVTDADGLGIATYTWLRDGVQIEGAGLSTYALGDADVGAVIQVQATYTDANGTVESILSEPTSVVVNVNDTPTGFPVINGIVIEDQILTVDASGISDADGLGTFSYQWTRDGVDVAGATGVDYTLGDADVGTQIRVRVSYTDGNGSVESVQSPSTAVVANINDAVTGTVTIDNTAPDLGRTLNASNLLADADGLGAIGYQWESSANGGATWAAIAGATAASYTTDTAGVQVRVVASYTDGNGTPESVASAATAAVLPYHVVTGTAVADALAGSSVFANLMSGLEGNDLMLGGAGADTIDGGAGVDTMAGGLGNDTYLVDVAGESIVDSGGTDTVLSTSASYTMGANVENLTQTAATATQLFGNSLNNLITGNVGNDRLSGNAGNDTLIGGLGNDSMLGGDGNDVLDGGAGVDTMVGGTGNDTYYVDVATDSIIFETTTGGLDTVYSTSTTSYTLGANLENLVQTSANGVALYGNSIDNQLTGNAGADFLRGGAGNDTLMGGAGNDSLMGGTGNDRFVFTAGLGNDWVQDFDANPLGGQDLLDISGLGISAAQFNALVTVTDIGADVRISFAGMADTIVLAGVGDPAAITASDFLLA